MAYIPPIPKGQLELYRTVAKAFRDARRKGGSHAEWHWAAVRAVIELNPGIKNKEAQALAAQIVRYAGMYYPKWFWG
jgi:hypothetical protein